MMRLEFYGMADDEWFWRLWENGRCQALGIPLSRLRASAEQAGRVLGVDVILAKEKGVITVACVTDRPIQCRILREPDAEIAEDVPE